jgi:hypothetical protein
MFEFSSVVTAPAYAEIVAFTRGFCPGAGLPLNRPDDYVDDGGRNGTAEFALSEGVRGREHILCVLKRNAICAYFTNAVLTIREWPTVAAYWGRNTSERLDCS